MIHIIGYPVMAHNCRPITAYENHVIESDIKRVNGGVGAGKNLKVVEVWFPAVKQLNP